MSNSESGAPRPYLGVGAPYIVRRNGRGEELKPVKRNGVEREIFEILSASGVYMCTYSTERCTYDKLGFTSWI